MGQRVKVILITTVLLVGGVFAIIRFSPERLGPDGATVGNTSVEGLGRVRVEVRNAGGIPGMARLATDELRDSGFDVVYYGNADEFGAETTLVLDRVGWAEAAAAVRQVLKTGVVELRPDSTRLVDMTILLGKDWKPKGANSVEGTTGSGAGSSGRN